MIDKQNNYQVLQKKPVKELQAYQEYLNKERAMSLLEQEKIFGKEQTYGTQGNFFWRTNKTKNLCTITQKAV